MIKFLKRMMSPIQESVSIIPPIENLSNSIFLLEVYSRMMIHQIHFNIFITNLTFHLTYNSYFYVCVHVKRRVLVNLFLQNLFLLLRRHFLLLEVEGSVCLLHLNNTTIILLAVNWGQVFIVPVVLWTLHWYLYFMNLNIFY